MRSQWGGWAWCNRARVSTWEVRSQWGLGAALIVLIAGEIGDVDIFLEIVLTGRAGVDIVWAVGNSIDKAIGLLGCSVSGLLATPIASR